MTENWMVSAMLSSYSRALVIVQDSEGSELFGIDSRLVTLLLFVQYTMDDKDGEQRTSSSSSFRFQKCSEENLVNQYNLLFSLYHAWTEFAKGIDLLCNKIIFQRFWQRTKRRWREIRL